MGAEGRLLPRVRPRPGWASIGSKALPLSQRNSVTVAVRQPPACRSDPSVLTLECGRVSRLDAGHRRPALEGGFAPDAEDAQDLGNRPAVPAQALGRDHPPAQGGAAEAGPP